MQPLADEYREQVNADVLLLTGRRGKLLGAAGPGAGELQLPPALRDPESLDEISTFVPHSRGVSFPVRSAVPQIALAEIRRDVAQPPSHPLASSSMTA